MDRTSQSDLRKPLIDGRVRRSDMQRRDYAQVQMESIASALASANLGYMADLCDIERGSTVLDPATSGLLRRRFGALSAADWDVTPAEGVDAGDRKWATQIADDVRRVYHGIGVPSLVGDIAWGAFDGRAAIELHWASGAWGLPFAPYGTGWVHPRRLSFGPRRELRIIEPTHWSQFTSDGIDTSEIAGKFVSWCPRFFSEYQEREGIGPRILFWSYFKRFAWTYRNKLTELFGLPWRIIEVDDDAAANPEDIIAARDEAEDLGGETTAAFAKGVKLHVEWPGENAGALFQMSHEQINAEIAKLVLGQSTTTDGDANRANGIIGKGEQDIIFQNDGAGINERLHRCMTLPIVMQSYGPGAMHLAPQFQIRTSPQRDREKDSNRIKVALGTGLTVAESEAREVFGFRAPLPDEPFLTMGPGSVDAQGNMVPGAITVVDPSAGKDKPTGGQAPDAVERAGVDGQAAAAGGDAKAYVDGAPGGAPVVPALPTTKVGDIELAPTDLAAVVTVNEARAANGLPDIEGGHVTIAEWKAAHASVIAEGEAASKGQASPTKSEDPNDPTTPPAGGGAPVPPGKPKPPGGGGSGGGGGGGIADVLKSVLGLRRAYLLDSPGAGKMTAPNAVFGSPEVLVVRGTTEAARETSRWANAIAEACTAEDAPGILKQAKRAVASLDVEKLARAIERRMVMGLMLGALDAHWEADNDRVIKPPAFDIGLERQGEGVELASIGPNGGVVDFATKPFAEAVSFFSQKSVIPRRAFDRLTATAKQRAFTVAGLAKDEMLNTVHAELQRSLEGKNDLRAFKASLAARFDSAGWTQLNASHVETVFRNATMGAYNSGRIAQMTQPAVLAARPFWQVLGVKDANTREHHRAVLGKVFPAGNMPVMPPFGHRCRCRVVSRSAADVERLGLEKGTTMAGLPDPGWSSTASLLGSDGPGTIDQGWTEPAAQPSEPTPSLEPMPEPPPPIAPEPVSTIEALPVASDNYTTLAKKQAAAVKAGVHPWGGTVAEFRAQAETAMEAASPEEQAALRKFTSTDYEPHRQSELDGKPDKTCQLIQAAFDKVPPAPPGVVYRGMSIENPAKQRAFLESVTSATDIGLGQGNLGVTSSCTYNLERAMLFANNADASAGEMRILYKLEHRTGIALETVSEVGVEREILMSRGARFRVTSVVQTKDELGPMVVVEGVEL